MKRPLDSEVLDARVGGAHLVPGVLRDQLNAEGETLLVFLRHLGCIFCRETIADLRLATEADPGFPPVVFFFQGTATEGRVFLRRYWPGARAVADPERWFYERFGIRQGSLMKTLGPSVWKARRRAAAKGHTQGEQSGDIWRMPGVFLVRDECIVWSHEYAHAADNPDFSALPWRLEAL